MLRTPNLRTIYTCMKQGEEIVMPSRTIPNRSLSASKAIEYLMNNEPIPMEFINSRYTLDKDSDGVFDAEVHMLEHLDELQIHEEKRSYLLSKLSSTEVEKAYKAKLNAVQDDKVIKEPAPVGPTSEAQHSE